MTRSRHAIASLGLLVALLGVMAFGAGAAQAEEGNHWKVGTNTLINDTLKPEVIVEKIENETGSFLTEISKIKVKILCKEMKLKEVYLLANGRISHGLAYFHKCVLYLNEKLSAPCEPFSEGTSGLIVTDKFKGLLSLHEGELLALIEPALSAELATISVGEECAIGEEIPVTGKLTILDPEISTNKLTHLIKEGPLSSLKGIGNPATIDGAAIVKLGSLAHAGLAFSGFML